LEFHLKERLGETTLGSDKVRTGLAICTKRFDTMSPWVLFNNPRAKYFNDGPNEHFPNDAFIGNSRYPLWRIIRASSAAPTFFAPVPLNIWEGEEPKTFVDGAVSPNLNPSVQLLALATAEGYQLKWPTGEKNLLIISVGAGGNKHKKSDTEMYDGLHMLPGSQALQALTDIMSDTEMFNVMIMQMLSRPKLPYFIDSEIDAMSNDLLGTAPLFSYQRYNYRNDASWLKTHLNLAHNAEKVTSYLDMSDPAIMNDCLQIGELFAERYVDVSHFPETFDIREN